MLINSQEMTSAAPHDSQSLDNLLTEKDKDQVLYADSVYVGQKETIVFLHYRISKGSGHNRNNQLCI